MSPETQKRIFWIQHFQGRPEQAMIWPEADEADYREKLEFLLPINERYQLKIESWPIMVEVFLVDVDQGEFKLGWDDQSHWHPHLLRWQELIAISQYIGKEEGGKVLLLLSSFTPICNDKDAAIAYPALKNAWESLGLFTDDEIQRWNDTFDTREGDFQWRQNEKGNWYIYQSPEDSDRGWYPLYSLRTEDAPDFPWQQWQEICQICQVDDCVPEIGSFFFNKYYSYTIHFDTIPATNKITDDCITRLGELLLATGLGWAETGGWVIDRERQRVGVSASVMIRNEPQQFGIALQKALSEFPAVTMTNLSIDGAENRSITVEELLTEQ